MSDVSMYGNISTVRPSPKVFGGTRLRNSFHRVCNAITGCDSVGRTWGVRVLGLSFGMVVSLQRCSRFGSECRHHEFRYLCFNL